MAFHIQQIYILSRIYLKNKSIFFQLCLSKSVGVIIVLLADSSKSCAFHTKGRHFQKIWINAERIRPMDIQYIYFKKLSLKSWSWKWGPLNSFKVQLDKHFRIILVMSQFRFSQTRTILIPNDFAVRVNMQSPDVFWCNSAQKWYRMRLFLLCECNLPKCKMWIGILSFFRDALLI